MKDKTFIDSNILLYAFDDRDTKKQSIAKKISLSSDNTISTQVINEASSNLIKKFAFDGLKISQFIDSCYRRYEVANIDYSVFKNSVDIRENYNISYYDSLIVSSALLSGCDILYSEDMQHNLIIDNLKIINPFVG
jgi:predicted nucleic acid-binding protein